MATYVFCKERGVMKTKMLVFKSGERFPILLGDDGIPLFYPTVYEGVMRRQVNLASATLSADLSSIKFLYSWAARMRIDLEQRFHKAEFLSLKEIENLTDAFRTRIAYYFDDIPDFSSEPAKITKPLKVKSMEAFRMRESHRPSIVVDTETAARRLYVVCNYLDWLARIRASWISIQSPIYEASIKARTEMKENIMVRIPEVKRTETKRREGLSQELQNILKEVIDPESPRNPWVDQFTRDRNELFLHLLLELGPRRGEVLQLRIGRDFNAGTNTLTIQRVPDDKDDPRINEPNAKTLDRDLPLSEKLAAMITNHIITARNTVKVPLSLDFLFVTAKTGRPLSKSAVSKIFHVLRRSIPELPPDFTAHVLRHTWNDNFSIECEKANMPEEVEEATRNYLQGWKKGSKTSGIYTQRYIKRKAHEVSLKMQERISKGKGNKE
jgi:integrase